MTATLERKAGLLSEKLKTEIDDWLARYPEGQRQSAVLAALRAVQHEDHYLSRDMMDAVADYIGMPEIAVYEVASFYSMFNLEPVGRNEIAICTNISCMLRGSDTIVSYLEKSWILNLGKAPRMVSSFLRRKKNVWRLVVAHP